MNGERMRYRVTWRPAGDAVQSTEHATYGDAVAASRIVSRRAATQEERDSIRVQLMRVNGRDTRGVSHPRHSRTRTVWTA